MKARRVVFIVQRLGPYHHARLGAFSEVWDGKMAVIEVRPDEEINKWGTVEAGPYRRYKTSSRRTLACTLENYRPDVIVCTGYSDPEIHQAMEWAFKHRTPLITCSDSSEGDKRRRVPKELFKRVLIGGFNAGLVAGTRSREYLTSLGMDSGRIFQPWDVVDNDHFSRSTPYAEERCGELRRKLGLAGDCFLFVGRFVREKNLDRLLASYAIYANRVLPQPWPLLLVGAGGLETFLKRQVNEMRLGSLVRFCGHADYHDLPSYYAMTSALVLSSVSETWGLVVNEAMAAGLPVLVSTRCGCAPDLVQEGRNGFLFDPENVQGLAALMVRLHRTNPERRREMGRRSREIIAGYSPEAFACGLTAAVGCALEDEGRRKSLVTRLAVRVLAGRRP
jgi:glycosyltransferase involved in cell wall biosynthesis